MEKTTTRRKSKVVVFYVGIIIFIILLIITTIMLSNIKLKLIDFTIKDYEDLKRILTLIKDKEYLKIFEHLDFILKLQLCILNKVPIFNFRVSDDGIAKFLRKQIRKRKLKREEKDIEKIVKDDKKQIDEDLPDINLEKLDLLMNLGTDNASFTALSTTALTVLISIALPFLVDEIKPQNYNYEINALYLDKPIFNINASLVLSMPATDIVKLIK